MQLNLFSSRLPVSLSIYAERGRVLSVVHQRWTDREEDRRTRQAAGTSKQQRAELLRFQEGRGRTDELTNGADPAVPLSITKSISSDKDEISTSSDWITDNERRVSATPLSTVTGNWTELV